MGDQQECSLRLTLGVVYRNSGEAPRPAASSASVVRALTMQNGQAVRRARDGSMPTLREIKAIARRDAVRRSMWNMERRNAARREMYEANKEAPMPTPVLPAAPRLPEMLGGNFTNNSTGSGHLAASSRTSTSVLLSSEKNSNNTMAIASMMANTKKVKAEEPSEEEIRAAERARRINENARRNKMLLHSTMPFVKTYRADGSLMAGFLCNYLHGNVIIACACHGHFLTPAEFVKHAGGLGYSNPYKEIFVFC